MMSVENGGVDVASLNLLRKEIQNINEKMNEIILNNSQYENGGTFFIGFIIEYLEKLNAIILIIYSSQPFNVVCEHQVFALRGTD